MASRAKPTPNTANRATHKDIRTIEKGMEVVREELGPDGDFAIDLHWHYDAP